jgi:hypothetical protein
VGIFRARFDFTMLKAPKIIAGGKLYSAPLQFPEAEGLEDSSPWSDAHLTP